MNILSHTLCRIFITLYVRLAKKTFLIKEIFSALKSTYNFELFNFTCKKKWKSWSRELKQLLCLKAYDIFKTSLYVCKSRVENWRVFKTNIGRFLRYFVFINICVPHEGDSCREVAHWHLYLAEGSTQLSSFPSGLPGRKWPIVLGFCILETGGVYPGIWSSAIFNC